MRSPRGSTLFPYTTLFRSERPSLPTPHSPLLSGPHSPLLTPHSRSEVQTSELQSPHELVFLLLVLTKEWNATWLLVYALALLVLGSFLWSQSNVLGLEVIR